MNVAATGLGLALAASVFGALIALVAPDRVRVWAVGGLTAVAGAAGLGTSVAGMAGQTFTVTLPDVLLLLGIRLALPVALTDMIVPDFPLTSKSFNLAYAGNDL